MGHTKIDHATETLRSILSPLKALNELGLPLQIPAELVDLCREIARLSEGSGSSPALDTGTPSSTAGELPEPPPNSEVSPEAQLSKIVSSGSGNMAAGGTGGIRGSSGTFMGLGTVAPPRATIRQAVIAVIHPGEEVSVKAVIERLKVAGVTANPDTVSNELSRRTAEGVLERPARGMYRLASPDLTRDHEPLAAEERPDDQEGLVGDADARTEGATMPRP